MLTRIAFIISLIGSFSYTAQAGGGCSPTSNGGCAIATVLTPGAPCVNGTTCSGGGASASSACIGAGYECSWYEFTATAANMFVSITMTATSGCYNRTEVFSGNGCGSLTSISCQSGAPIDDMHSLTGLTIGNTYYVQVCYAPGGPCGNGGYFEYCIEVGEPDPPCDVCATPCGTAQGYPTNPTVQQVVDDCQTSPFVPALQPGSTHTYCYNFTATATSVNFNVIITSTCTGGNVTNFSWQLYSIACGAPIQTGTLASLTFSPVVIGASYVFCYTFTVPSTCTQSQHCPFFVGATVLPIELTSFTAEPDNNGFINLNWETASELNNDYFTIERTRDGHNFEVVGEVLGAGTSTESRFYELVDRNPYSGISYYRLTQTDYDGVTKSSSLVAVELPGILNDIAVIPNPINGSGQLRFNSQVEGNVNFVVRDLFGNEVLSQDFDATRGDNQIDIDGKSLTSGLYLISLIAGDEINTIKFVKE